MNNDPNTSDLVRVAEAVRRAELPITSTHVARLIKAGVVKGQRIGHLWYATADDLNSALRSDSVIP